MMVVIAILGILAALTLAGMRQLGERSAAQNAAHDLSATLGRARAMAMERGSDIWVIVYVNINQAGTAGAGHGAYFLFEDPDFRFGGSAVAPVAGEIRFTGFSPTSESTMVPTGGRCKLLERTYLDLYQGDLVSFSAPSSPPTLTTPFTWLGTPSSGCSFCSGTPRRGAVVFDAEGRARFYDGSGNELPRQAGGAGRAGYVALDTPTRDFVFAVSAATGFIANYAH